MSESGAHGGGGSSLAPPPARAGLSVAHLPDAWYVACESHELGEEPLARTVLGTPLALFRDASGAPGALLDRCPHRNVPLSLGRRAAAGHLECGYHGWQFDRAGACRAVPGLFGEPPESRARCVPAHATLECDGLVFVWGRAGAEPRGDALRVPEASDASYVVVRRTLDLECTLHAALENALDVPHTAFAHRGRFRGGVTNEIEAVRRRIPGGVEVEYLGEKRGPGESKNRTDGRVIRHWDRFILPSIAQVEYRDGSRHLLATLYHTPITDTLTRAYFVQCFRLPGPRFLVRALVGRSVDRVLQQDVAILREQTAALRRFGGEQYASTELDLLGPEIWRMLRQAERGLDPEAKDVSARVKLRV
jgi:phenylpropionate dioxygenase-like ring-hydroxylating dioxygenase large terminal subunit